MSVVPITHMSYGAEQHIPDAAEELRLADWHLRCGLDRLGDEHHIGVKAHSQAARTQLAAVLQLLDRETR